MNDDVLAAVGRSREEIHDFNGAGEKEVSLTNFVDEAIEDHINVDDGESDRHKSRVGVYHASSGAKCIRKRWYSDKNIKKAEYHEFPVGIGHRGDVTEGEVERALTGSLNAVITDELREEIGDQLYVGNEYPVSVEIEEFPGESFYITGSTDPYIEDENGDLLEVVEVKSANSPPEEPKFKHLVQLNTYLSALGLETGTIIYIDPSNWDRRKVFEIEQDPELWEFTKTMNYIYHRYRLDNELPPRTPFGDECNGCPYVGYCQRNDTGEGWEEENFPPDQSVPTDQKTNFL